MTLTLIYGILLFALGGTYEKRQVMALNEKWYQIDEVASKTGLTKRTLRYYEERELLEPSARTDSGYRLYTESDIEGLMHIKYLKECLGFTLDEIKEVLEAEEMINLLKKGDIPPSEAVAKANAAIRLLSNQINTIDTRIERLKDMKKLYTNKIKKLKKLPCCTDIIKEE